MPKAYQVEPINPYEPPHSMPVAIHPPRRYRLLAFILGAAFSFVFEVQFWFPRFGTQIITFYWENALLSSLIFGGLGMWLEWRFHTWVQPWLVERAARRRGAEG